MIIGTNYGGGTGDGPDRHPGTFHVENSRFRCLYMFIWWYAGMQPGRETRGSQRASTLYCGGGGSLIFLRREIDPDCPDLPKKSVMGIFIPYGRRECASCGFFPVSFFSCWCFREHDNVLPDVDNIGVPLGCQGVLRR